MLAAVKEYANYFVMQHSDTFWCSTDAALMKKSRKSVTIWRNFGQEESDAFLTRDDQQIGFLSHRAKINQQNRMIG